MLTQNQLTCASSHVYLHKRLSMHFAHDAGSLQMTAVLYAHDAKHLLMDAHSERKMGLAPF